MSSINKVILVGRVGQDPEAVGTGGARFSLATSEKWTSRDGNAEEATEWHSIVCWRHSAEFALKYMAKGDLMYIEGRIQTREYVDDSGVQRRSVSINAMTVQKLSSPERRGQSKNEYSQEQPTPTKQYSQEEQFRQPERPAQSRQQSPEEQFRQQEQSQRGQAEPQGHQKAQEPAYNARDQQRRPDTDSRGYGRDDIPF